MHYIVTEGRARTLDLANVHDRSTYGVDWLVLDATSARDAVRQWNLFKAGTHSQQGRLELEAAAYRTTAPGYVPAWQAESEIVASDIEHTLRHVDERRRELERLEADLEGLRTALGGAAPGPSRPAKRRRRAAKRPTRPGGARAGRQGRRAA
jgi:hypothetical protein